MLKKRERVSQERRNKFSKPTMKTEREGEGKEERERR